MHDIPPPSIKEYPFQSFYHVSKNVSKWLAIGAVVVAKPTLAQTIAVDGSTATQLSGANCAVDCTITGGLRDGNGSGPNLFHSFSLFNVGSSASVTFTDPGVENIFSRVTGPTLSAIEGTLKVDGSANLFLLNPNGITFGENARLELQGSFLASTGDRIVFADNIEFSANPSSLPSLLTVNVPLGVQFGASPRPITLQGRGHSLVYDEFEGTVARSLPTTGLTIPNGQTLALLGGDIVMQGANLISDSGHIEVASLGGNAFVQFNSDRFGSNLNNSFDYSRSNAFKDIEISQQSSIDVSGNNAGSLQMQGRQINISEGSALIAQTLTSGGGQIFVNVAESLNMTGVELSATEPMPTSIYLEITPGAMGDGSSQLTVTTPQLTLQSGAQIGLGIAGGGTSGIVDISAQTIALDGGSGATFSGIFAAVLPVLSPPFGLPPGAVGQGGDINITANQLRLTDGAQIVASTFGPGNAGNIAIEANDIEVLGARPASASGPGSPSSIVSASEIPVLGPPRFPPLLPNGSGKGGGLTILTDRLEVAEGGQISVATNSSNPAGNLRIEASDSIELRGGTAAGRSGLFASSRIGTGTGGNIQVDTNRLSLLEGATINASNFASTLSGPPPGSGAAGNIEISATAITLKDGSLITTDTVSGDRANITLQSDSLVLRRGSNITTNATGTATGGNISIDTTALLAFENSDITANADDNFGGRVIVNAQTIIGTAYRDQLTAESDITASSALGPAFGGTVELNTPQLDPTEGLSDLPEGLSSAEKIVAACEQLESNTFVATGRGGLPSNPSQLVTDQSAWNGFRFIRSTDSVADSNSNNNRERTTENGFINTEPIDTREPSQASLTILSEPIVETQSWSLNDDGDIVLDTNSAASSFTAHHSESCLANGWKNT
ncbi:MAG: S-layer family protein [Phormidesmis sp.]